MDCQEPCIATNNNQNNYTHDSGPDHCIKKKLGQKRRESISKMITDVKRKTELKRRHEDELQVQKRGKCTQLLEH